MNPSANSSSMQQPSIQSPNQLQLTKTKSAKSDRHLKVDGRDRRIRLPASCAKRLFDLNKKLNHKTPGQTVEWLMNRSSSTIDDVLKSKNTPNATAAEAPAPAPAPAPPTAVMINPTDDQNAMVVKHANAAATTVVNVVNPHLQDQLMAYQHQYPMGTYRLSQLMQVPMAPAPPAVAAAANTMYFNTINVGFSGFQGGGFAGNHGISGGVFAAVRDNRVIMEQSSSSRGVSSTTVQNETEISGDDDEDNIDQFLRDDDA